MFSISQLFKNISKGQSGIPTRYIFQQLENIAAKLQPRIKLLKVEKSDDGYLVYLLVPSESDIKRFYDVDFWFQTEGRINNDTLFKVYSNSPNFGYSYVYLFNKEGSLLFPEKYPKIMLTDIPKVRNPFAISGFDKHLFSGLKFIFRENLQALSLLSKGGTVQVQSFESKMSEIGMKKKK